MKEQYAVKERNGGLHRKNQTELREMKSTVTNI